MKDSIRHEPYMKRCIDLAETALGQTAPNPLVGSVIVRESQIIGEGHHRGYGLPHAEVNAIHSVADKNLLKTSTLYVNLEPCSHTGKTPPCADLIIRNGIPEVVIGMVDPNPLVAGKGIQKLKSAGVNTTVGVLEKDCKILNRRFCMHHENKRPYVILKWAQTKDGFIDRNRAESDLSKPAWISNPVSKMLVHKWRAEEQAILVGTNTALLDNPRLNVREWTGQSPIRMVIDKDLRLPGHLHLFNHSEKTWIFNASVNSEENNTRFIRLDFSDNILYQIMDCLYEASVQSLFVEGGRQLIDAFIAAGLWDEARVITGDKTFVSGVSAPVIPSGNLEEYHIMYDVLQIYHRTG